MSAPLPEVPVSSELCDAVLASVAELTRDGDTPGVAVGVLAGGSLATGGVGSAWVGGPAVTGSTQFRICSVTKPMTSTLVALLAEAGALDLDEPLTRRLPALALADASARDHLSLRHLLLHTSGLQGEWEGTLADYGRDATALRSLVSDYGRLRQYAAPGRHWGYCNTGYWLAGHVAASTTGLSYEQALAEHLLVPLAMDDTVTDAGEADADRLARPHLAVADAAPRELGHDFPRARVPSGGVISTVHDLLLFAAEHLAPGRVLSAAAALELRRPAVLAHADGSRQALGWMCEDGAIPVIGHSGLYEGYTSALLLAPDVGLAVALLANSTAGGAVLHAALERVRVDVLGHAAEPDRTADVDVSRLDRALGDYDLPGVDRARIEATDDGLVLRTDQDGAHSVSRLAVLSELELEVVDGAWRGASVELLPDPDAPEAPVPHVRVMSRLGARIGS